jgi:hypothetical protein
MKYKIVVNDNYHYMDEGESYTHGEFETAEAALGAARALVDEDLRGAYRPGMTADELYDQYTSFGEDPFIVSEDQSCRFSAWTYAEERCREMCSPTAQTELSATADSQRPPVLAEWFRVHFDETHITLQVSPPNLPPWEAHIGWERISRVCFKAGDFDSPDEIYLFTDERPESYLIPTEAGGGAALWDEIIRRKLFDAELAIEAASATDKLFCDPAAE